jgi:biopolymer transport protein ExbB/TolQ
MKIIALLLIILALAATTLAQVSPEDYRAWRTAERVSYQRHPETTYQAWRAAERASYRRNVPDAFQAWRRMEQASYRDNAQQAYRAWRRSEQAAYRAVAAWRRGEPLVIVTP